MLYEVLLIFDKDNFGSPKLNSLYFPFASQITYIHKRFTYLFSQTFSSPKYALFLSSTSAQISPYITQKTLLILLLSNKHGHLEKMRLYV